MNNFTSLLGFTHTSQAIDIDCFIAVDERGDSYITIEDGGKLLFAEHLTGEVIDTLSTDLINHQSREISALFKFLRVFKSEILTTTEKAKALAMQRAYTK